MSRDKSDPNPSIYIFFLSRCAIDELKAPVEVRIAAQRSLLRTARAREFKTKNSMAGCKGNLALKAEIVI
jgi:hypothetical protein